MNLPDIGSLLPHSGPMVLLDRVVAVDEESLCADVRLGDDSLFCVNGTVAAWVGIEYMAQAIGAYAGYCARQRGERVRVGYLLGTRSYDCTQPYFTVGSRLKIHVKRVWQGTDGLASFDCRIEGDDGMLAKATVTVYQQPDGDNASA